MAKTICPFLRKACIEAKCQLWVVQLRTSPEKGTFDVSNCAFVIQVELANRALNEQVRTTATVDQLRKEEEGKGEALRELAGIAAVAGVAARRALGDGHDDR